MFNNQLARKKTHASKRILIYIVSFTEINTNKVQNMFRCKFYIEIDSRRFLLLFFAKLVWVANL